MLDFPLNGTAKPGFRLSTNLTNTIGEVGVNSVMPATICKAAKILLKNKCVLTECFKNILKEDRTSFDLPQLLTSMTDIVSVRANLQAYIESNSQKSTQWNPCF